MPTQTETDNRRADIEKMLTEQFHVEWTYIPDVPLDEIDIEKSLDNQARDEPLDEPTLEAYTDAARDGDPFPPIIVHCPGRSAKRKKRAIDGNHRINAFKAAGRTTIDVYQVADDTKPETIDLMTFTINVKNGLQPSEGEKLRHAIRLLDNDAPVPFAARMVGLSEAKVRAEWNRVQASRRALDANVNVREWDSLSRNVQHKLNGIKTDEGFAEAAKLAYQAKLSGDETAEMVKTLNTSRSGSAQAKMVKDATKDPTMRSRIQSAAGGMYKAPTGRRAMGPKQQLGSALTQLKALPDAKDVAKLYTPNEQDQIVERIEDGIAVLVHLGKAMRA